MNKNTFLNKCNFILYGEVENKCTKCGYIAWVNKKKTFSEIILDMVDNGYPMPDCMLNNEMLTMEQRLEKAGIETIYPADYMFSRHEKRVGEVKLKYKEKEILRPKAQSCISVVKKEFNLDI